MADMYYNNFKVDSDQLFVNDTKLRINNRTLIVLKGLKLNDRTAHVIILFS